MFGISMREKLEKRIICACIDCKNIYKKSIASNLDELNKLAEKPEWDVLWASIRREYLDHAMVRAFESCCADNPKLNSRIDRIMLSPSICGYEISLVNGVLAGSVFAILWYAIKNTVAPPDVCVKLNHIHNDIMTETLIELDNELGIKSVD